MTRGCTVTRGYAIAHLFPDYTYITYEIGGSKTQNGERATRSS
jgi:hypothetical protein